MFGLYDRKVHIIVSMAGQNKVEWKK